MAASISALPPSLKSLQHYIKTACEHDKRDPVVAYYCRLYSLQRAMELDKKSPEARAFLMTMMDILEKSKKELGNHEAITSEMVGQAHIENYALKLFLYADNEDRAGRFGKNVVKSFYTAGMVMDVLANFGEVSEDIEKNRKYAKWKAAYIHNCLKNGESPHAGPLEEEEGREGGDDAHHYDDLEASGFDWMRPAPSSKPPTGPSQPPATSNYGYPPAQPPQPPATSNYGYPPAQPPQPPQLPQLPHNPYSPQQASAPAPAAAAGGGGAVGGWTPPPNPSGVKLTAVEYQRGMKLCKYATSAMQYEDAQTAVENLVKAYNLMTKGHE